MENQGLAAEAGITETGKRGNGETENWRIGELENWRTGAFGLPCTLRLMPYAVSRGFIASY